MRIKNFSFVDFWHENSIFSRNISRKSSILTNKMTKIQVLKKQIFLDKNYTLRIMCFFLSFQCFLTVLTAVRFKGGVHLIAEVSTVNLGLLYSELLMCSSTNFGVTQMTCWPFQYLTKFKACKVEMMSGWVIDVIALKS